MAIQYETPLDRTFHALGDNTRRQMISALAGGDLLTAGELGKPFNISQPSVSKHLSVLEKAGLIKRTVEGRTHSFSLNPAPLTEADEWINQHTAFWKGALSQLSALVAEVKKDETHD